MKKCNVCGQTKDLSAFPKRNNRTSGVASRCKACLTRIQCERWRSKDPRAKKDFILKKTYGISIETFESMLEAQGGVCAACKGPPTPIGFHVDHDHESGAVRGILCHYCNTGLGHARDSVERLWALIAYLQRTAAVPDMVF